MRTVINPPSILTLLSGWLRGGISVVLSFALMYLVAGLVISRQLYGPFLPLALVFVGLWTALTLLQAVFEHTVTVTAQEVLVRTWFGALLGRRGRSYPLQPPQLSLARRGGRPGGGLRSSRLALYDATGRWRTVTFTLISYDRLSQQLAESAMGRSGTWQPYRY